jgi:hypothetical protein
MAEMSNEKWVAYNGLTPEKRKAIYDQDCQYDRHRQVHQWARFNTIAVIEGGALFAAFAKRDLARIEYLGLWAFAAFIVVAISFLAEADAQDVSSHLLRIKAYESNSFQARTTGWPAWVIRAALALITAFNFVVLGHLLGRC